jgi:hypothetical protein
MMTKASKKRDDNGMIPRITKTCKVVLVDNDGVRYPLGDFTLTEPEPGPSIDDFADAAFKSARASLARLMVPQYRLIVTDGDREQGYGLDRWIKLVDNQKLHEARLAGKGPKQTLRKTG